MECQPEAPPCSEDGRERWRVFRGRRMGSDLGHRKLTRAARQIEPEDPGVQTNGRFGCLSR